MKSGFNHEQLTTLFFGTVRDLYTAAGKEYPFDTAAESLLAPLVRALCDEPYRLGRRDALADLAEAIIAGGTGLSRLTSQIGAASGEVARDDPSRTS